MEKYLKLFGKDSLSFVTADREFIGREWFRYLRRKRLPFRIHIRSAKILPDYALRWKIESLFGCLKSRGFCLEETHLTERERLEKLLALLMVAFCWAYIAGQWLARAIPIKIKKHDHLAKSLFRHGFDHLRRIQCNQDASAKRFDFIRLCNLLSCT
ncbi:MAG: transposase [Acidobacteria bacterium]|nr:transposase [Acidobacteriota bacterium]